MLRHLRTAIRAKIGERIAKLRKDDCDYFAGVYWHDVGEVGRPLQLVSTRLQFLQRVTDETALATMDQSRTLQSSSSTRSATIFDPDKPAGVDSQFADLSVNRDVTDNEVFVGYMRIIQARTEAEGWHSGLVSARVLQPLTQAFNWAIDSGSFRVRDFWLQFSPDEDSFVSNSIDAVVDCLARACRSAAPAIHPTVCRYVKSGMVRCRLLDVDRHSHRHASHDMWTAFSCLLSVVHLAFALQFAAIAWKSRPNAPDKTCIGGGMEMQTRLLFEMLLNMALVVEVSRACRMA